MTATVMRIIGVLGILWNAGGVAAYLGHVGALGGAPGPAMPAIVTAAFATAGLAGLAGSLGLALLKRWASPLLWLSFAAAVVNWGWVFLYGRGGELALGLSVLAIALVLAILSGRLPKATADPA